MNSPLFMIIVFSFSIGIATFFFENKENRQKCWDEYVAVQVCLPKYDKCSILMESDCPEKFGNCTKRMIITKTSQYCNDLVLNATDSVMRNADFHQLDLVKELINPEEKTSKNEICDVSVFKYRNIFRHNISSLAEPVVTQLPLMISKYCECQLIDYQDTLSESLSRSSKSNVPIRFWYGGLRKYKCWKEVDRALVQLLCGDSSSFLINHEWAKHLDCLEHPKRTNCTTQFMESLETVSKRSEKPLFCSIYVEIIQKSLLFFDIGQFDYKMVYVEESSTFEHEIYQDEELYLIDQRNDDISFKCFSIKRTINSCNFMYTGCMSQENCMVLIIKCIEDNMQFSPECVSALIQSENSINLIYGFASFIWEHKWKPLLVILIGGFYAIFKNARNWLIKRWSIKACLKLKLTVEKATKYADTLLTARNDVKPERLTISITIDEAENEEQFIDNEEGVLLPVDLGVEEVDAIEDESPEIQLGNNEPETNSQEQKNNEDNVKKEESDEPKSNPKLWESFLDFLRALWRMTRSYSKISYIFLIFPAYNGIRNSFVKYFTSPRPDENFGV